MKKKVLIIFVFVGLVIIYSCKKDPEIPTGNKIEIGQTAIDTISYFDAEVSSDITNTGGNEIIEHGHCWGVEEEPNTDNTKTQLGKLNEPKTFTSQLTELNDNTKYFVRSYITYQHGTFYGLEESIQTLKTGKPVVASTDVSNVTINSAHFSSEILADSGLTVTMRGFCWDTTNVFTVSDCLDTTIVGSGLGVLNSEVSSLSEGVNYFVKGYAINEKGVSYGKVEEFSTVPITLPEVTTDDITEVTVNSATCGGNVLSNGNGTVTARGVCWNINGNPTLENNIGFNSTGNGLGNYESYATELSENTTYYVAAYATNEKGTDYGDAIEFTTLEITLPEVNTNEVTDITVNSARSGGNVISDGNGTVSEHGVCWNTSGNPTLEDNLGFTLDGTGLGTYISQINGLSNGITYFVAAYTTNEKGTGYGEVKQFSTVPITNPSVITTEITDITNNSATGGGNVTSNGNSTVIERGVCWNTLGNPTLENNLGCTTNGNGIGSFTSQITSLFENTIYYVAAYAINEKSTGYGQDVSFETIMGFTDPRDGQFYEIIVIGSQTWMAENLNYETTNSWWYDNSSANGDVYGRLYTWEAATTACPDGWYLPTDDEWKTLEMYLGMSQVEADNTGDRGTDEGKKMKSTSGWDSGGNGTDTVGFKALPGGRRNFDKDFGNLGYNGTWWSATASTSTAVWVRRLTYDIDGVYRGIYGKDWGLSVRCIMD